MFDKIKSFFAKPKKPDGVVKNYETDDKPSKIDYVEKHAEIMTEFSAVLDASWDIREQCLSDRKFAFERGAQWDWDTDGAFKNRPQVESNKILQAIKDAMADMLNNSITTKFNATKDGSDDLASVVAGIFRADKRRGYLEAVKNAMLEADAGGIGAYRLIVTNDKYSENPEYKCLQFLPITDADQSVFWYSDGRLQDKSDASGCIVISQMSRAEFKRKYEREPVDWDKITYSSRWCWVSDNTVDVADVYEYEDVDCEKVYFEIQGVDGSEIVRDAEDYDEDEQDRMELAQLGYVEVERKTLKERKVRRYIVDGQSILEDCGYINGNVIPVVMLYGMRWFIEGVERYSGRVRVCRDMMILYNMMLSNLQEMVEAFGTEKYILTPDQTSGHEKMWQTDAIENYIFLHLNGVDSGTGEKVIPPLQKTTPPQIPPALAALLQVAGQDVLMLAGNGGNTEQIVANASGKMMEIARATIDKGNALLIDNVKDSELMLGKVWLSMAREIYVEDDREVVTLDESGARGKAMINRPYMPAPGVLKYEADLTESDFDLDVTIGPATQSERDSTANNLLAILKTGVLTPDIAQAVALKLMQLLDGEGLSDIKEYFRKELVKLGVVEPNEEEKQAMQQAASKPNPQDEYMLAAAAQAESDAIKSQSEAMLNAARIEKTNAETEKLQTDTLAKMQEMQAQNQQIIQVMSEILNRIDNFKQQSLPEVQQPELQPQQIEPFRDLGMEQQGAALNQFGSTVPQPDVAS